MNLGILTLIVTPIIILIYRAQAAKNRMLINIYEEEKKVLQKKIIDSDNVFEEVMNEWSQACVVLDAVNRRLGDCMCGQRLTQKQEAMVMSVLSNAELIDYDIEDN